MTGKDYSLYVYYRGSDEYPSRKARYFGEYEGSFERSYRGGREGKAAALRQFMHHVIYERTADACMFGMPGVDEEACLARSLRQYYEPDFESELWEARRLTT